MCSFFLSFFKKGIFTVFFMSQCSKEVVLFLSDSNVDGLSQVVFSRTLY